MITFIATAYQEQFEPYVFIGSMLCQSDPRWKAIIYHNGANPRLRKIVESFNDPRLIYKETLFNNGNWGCLNRIDALNEVDTDYVVQTSIQDYWSPNAVAEIIANRWYDFIYWNSTHHSFGYNILDAQPRIGSIDWGNFAIKTEIAKKVGINHPESYTADGEFVIDAINWGDHNLQLKLSMIKISKILTIKN